jgi:hypothetical protein
MKTQKLKLATDKCTPKLFIAFKDRLSGVASLHPIWQDIEQNEYNSYKHYFDNLKRVTIEDIFKKLQDVSHAMFKVTYSWRPDYKETDLDNYLVHIKTLKNVTGETMVGDSINGEETIAITRSGELARLSHMTVEEHYTKTDLSPFIRRYCFMPDTNCKYISTDPFYWPVRYLWAPEPVRSEDRKDELKDWFNYVFLLETENDTQRNVRDIVELLYKLPTI